MSSNSSTKRLQFLYHIVSVSLLDLVDSIFLSLSGLSSAPWIRLSLARTTMSWLQDSSKVSHCVALRELFEVFCTSKETLGSVC